MVTIATMDVDFLRSSLAERRIVVWYESIREWCNRFGLEYARKLKERQDLLGDTWVYFAALAWNSSLLRDEALVEGFTPIEPDKCTSIVPYGMSRIYISLFIYD